MLFEHVCERLATRHLAGNTRQGDCPICGSVLTIVRVGEDASLSCAGKCTPADVEWHLLLVPTQSATLADLLVNLGERIDRGEPIITTLPCGWALLDSTIGGLVGGEYLGIVGGPGAGKSTLADQLALTVLENDPDATALIIALETDPAVRACRLLASRAVEVGPFNEIRHCLPVTPILRGTLEHKDAAHATIDKLAAVASRMVFRPDLATAGAIAGVIETTRPTVVVLDHLGLVALGDESKGTSEIGRFDAALQTIHNAIHQTGSAGILINELSKAALVSGAPGLSSSRGSARFASLAASYVQLATDADADAATGSGTVIVASLLKSRFGESGIQQRCRFMGGLAHFCWADPEPIQRRKKKGGNDANGE